MSTAADRRDSMMELPLLQNAVDLFHKSKGDYMDESKNKELHPNILFDGIQRFLL